jgi:PAS domain S-box-containing protein
MGRAEVGVILVSMPLRISLPAVGSVGSLDPAEAEHVLRDLAAVFGAVPVAGAPAGAHLAEPPDLHEMYRTLVEQIPAVVFMAHLDRGFSDAYVSPQIEEALGYSQEEWLEDPIRWYQHIHPQDRQRWSVEAADLFTTGRPLRSTYRVVARDGRVIWFHCEAKLLRDQAGHPWLLHGVAFDITERKLAEEQLRGLLDAAKLAERRLLDSLAEKDVLLREIHHRVKNNLAVISSLFYLQSTYTDDQGTLKLLEESQDRVRSMALVHELLYGSENLAAVDFAKYVSDLCEQLIQTYAHPAGRIRLTKELEPVRLNIDHAIPCGLILNEVVSNALKHAFPGARGGVIHVTLRREAGGECLLRVADDGAGIPAELDLATQGSLGLRLIRTLTRQLDGRIELLPAHPGTEVRLVFGAPP